ncbi:hypothetical protein ACQ4PT_038795 [Festuca glaucescens]
MDPFTTDVLVEILLRLPPNSRRCSRLVCRCWRHLVDKRTVTDLRSRAQTLLVAAGGAALILGDNVGRSPRKMLASAEGRKLSVVGTCNGLICLCDDGKPPGAVALANPATGERLVLSPLPCAADIIARLNSEWHLPYSFPHNQTTRRYTVVHVPCCFDRVYEFDVEYIRKLP